MAINDRFPYNMPSRDALVRLVNTDTGRTLRPDQISFDDMYFAPIPTVPGRTYIEITDHTNGGKEAHTYRRLELSHQKCLGVNTRVTITGRPTPALIAAEINRSRDMHFGPDDVSFATTAIPFSDTTFVYTMVAMTGSYAYVGETTIIVEVVEIDPFSRLLEDGTVRLLEDGAIRELEHQ